MTKRLFPLAIALTLLVAGVAGAPTIVWCLLPEPATGRRARETLTASKGAREQIVFGG